MVPLIKADPWWIRIWDFPRLQLAGVAVGLGAVYLGFVRDRVRVKILFGGGLFVGLALDAYRMLPYSPLWKRETLRASRHDPKSTLSLIAANVLQQNPDSAKMLRLIQRKSPDLVFLVEVNERWLKELAPLRREYAFHIEQGRENEYGVAFYSKLRVDSASIEHLVEPTVPSVCARVFLRSGEAVQLFGIHPRPPRPQEGPSTNRDAELVRVARKARDTPDPVIVMGDINDVAWSHTTRLFRRISRLLDPRVGRGPYPTFPAQYPPLRFPLDYVFHSRSFRLVSIERLEAAGSDHLPLFVELSLESSRRGNREAPPPKKGDREEADNTLRRERRQGSK